MAAVLMDFIGESEFMIQGGKYGGELFMGNIDGFWWIYWRI